MLPTDAGRCRRKPRWMAAQFLDRALHSCLAEQSGQPEVITAPHQLAGALLYRVEHGPHAVALQQLVLVAARRLRGKVLHYQPLQPAGWNRAILHMTTATRKHEQQRQPGGSGSAAAEYAARGKLPAPSDPAPHAAANRGPRQRKRSSPLDIVVRLARLL